MYMYTCYIFNETGGSKFFTQTATDPSCNNTSVRGMYAVTFVCTRPSVDRAPASHGETLLYPQCGCLNEDGRGGMWEKGRGEMSEKGKRRGKRKGIGGEGGGREEGRGGRDPTVIGASTASPTLVVKKENCLYMYIYMYIHVCIYVWYMRIPYIYILPHLCAMQYFHIAC